MGGYRCRRGADLRDGWSVQTRLGIGIFQRCFIEPYIAEDALPRFHETAS